MAKLHLYSRLLSYIVPLLLIPISFYYLLLTVLRHPLLPFTSPSSFSALWFSRLWTRVGPPMADSPDSVKYLQPLLSKTRGVVLELGPGSGDQMARYKDIVGQIQHFYCAEPNEHLHGKLLEKMLEAGFQREKVTILTCGAEAGSLLPALKTEGLIETDLGREVLARSLEEKNGTGIGVFDTIVSVKSLCSSPQSLLPETIAVLQALLRPHAGARFLWYEHVGNTEDKVTYAWAKVVNPLWSFFVGGCRLDSPLDQVCKEVRGWKESDVFKLPEQNGYELLRWVRAEYVKA